MVARMGTKEVPVGVSYSSQIYSKRRSKSLSQSTRAPVVTTLLLLPRFSFSYKELLLFFQQPCGHFTVSLGSPALPRA